MDKRLRKIVSEAVKGVLNEIGDTPRGNFALNAVRGRRAAKRYRTNMNAADDAENNRMIGMASDEAWKNSKDSNMGYNNDAGYRYGFDKGVEKYGKNGMSESRINSIVRKSVKSVIREAFEDDYNAARDKFMDGRPNGMWGFEMKNGEGDWEYGEVTYDPATQTMSCMGASVEVDPSLSVDQNLEALYDELLNKGYEG